MKNNTAFFFVTAFFGFSLHATPFNEWWLKTKAFVQKRPATIIAAVSAPIAVICFYYGITAKNEREALEKMVPDFERLRANLKRDCAVMNRGHGPLYRINWGRVYDTIVRRKSPQLADQLLSAHLREGLLIPAIMVSFLGVLYGAIAYQNEWENINQEVDATIEIA